MITLKGLFQATLGWIVVCIFIVLVYTFGINVVIGLFAAVMLVSTAIVASEEDY